MGASESNEPRTEKIKRRYLRAFPYLHDNRLALRKLLIRVESLSEMVPCLGVEVPYLALLVTSKRGSLFQREVPYFSAFPLPINAR
jgi:hypothetical protein